MTVPASGRPSTAPHIVIAPDSFKGTLSAREAAEAIRRGLAARLPGARFTVLPLSDGGEGLVDALLDAAGAGRRARRRVRGPLGAPVDAGFAVLPPSRDGAPTVAVLETAAASGLTLVPASRRDPERATTYGTGELIAAALDAGAARVIVGLGGSATTDGGAGCAQALGVALLDARGRPVGPGGAGLAALDRIDPSGRDGRLASCRIEGACDVTNVLLGPEGAAAVYGPNKGLTPDGVRRMDANLARLADVIERDMGVDVRELPGGGAAGGLGAGLAAFCGARLDRGIERMLDACGLDAVLRDADAVVTGEGRIDEESAYGKVPAGVAARAAAAGVPAFVLAGQSRLDESGAKALGFAAVRSVVRAGVSEEQAFADPAGELERLAAEAAERIAP